MSLFELLLGCKLTGKHFVICVLARGPVPFLKENRFLLQMKKEKCQYFILYIKFLKDAIIDQVS